MSRLQSTLCMLAAFSLAGCGQLIKHEVDISRQLREQPVRSVLVLPPSFPAHVEQDSPEDYTHMLPANQEETGAKIVRLIQLAVGSSVTVESNYSPTPQVLAWAAAIGKDLVKERVPLRVPEIDAPMDSILVTGIVSCGMKLNQYSYHLFPFLPWTKRRYVGERTWDHVFDLKALLVRPADGFILFYVRHGELENLKTQDPELLEDLILRAGRILAQSFVPER